MSGPERCFGLESWSWPGFRGRGGLGVDLVGRPDDDEGRTGHQVMRLEQTVDRGFPHEVALDIGEPHGQFARRQFGRGQRQVNNAIADLAGDAGMRRGTAHRQEIATRASRAPPAKSRRGFGHHAADAGAEWRPSLYPTHRAPVDIGPAISHRGHRLAVTRQTVFDRSSATIRAPRGSTETPTGRPRALPSPVRKPDTTSIGSPAGRPSRNGTKTTR